MSRAVAILLVLAALAGPASCSTRSDGRVRVVASMYPLAWIARQVGGPRVDVEDLTPPGVEAHDTTLTAAQRADLETAGVVVYLGDLGFQPDVERSVADASGTVVDATSGLPLLPSQQAELRSDPHVWLDPVLMERIVADVRVALAKADPGGADGYRARAAATDAALADLDLAFGSGLTGCDFRTFVTTHEAFGYLADRYGLHQLGIEGLSPESEPSAARIQDAVDAIHRGTAAPAVFYEATDEGRRVGESVASDAGVRAFPLGTLESDPAPKDYLDVMRENLVNLREGLRCGG